MNFKNKEKILASLMAAGMVVAPMTAFAGGSGGFVGGPDPANRQPGKPLEKIDVVLHKLAYQGQAPQIPNYGHPFPERDGEVMLPTGPDGDVPAPLASPDGEPIPVAPGPSNPDDPERPYPPRPKGPTAKLYDPAKYGDVGFTVYRIDKANLPKGKTGQEIADVVEADPTSFGATKVGEEVKVNEKGVATFKQLDNTGKSAYVFVETTTSKMIKQKARPMFIRLPMTAMGQFYLNEVNLYPKNETQELTIDFTKLARKNGEDTDKPLEGAQFKLYMGKKGEGVAIKDGEEDKIFTTNAEGKITLPGLVKGEYYLVEQEVAGKIDGMTKKVTEKRTDVGELLTGADAQNDAENKLGFVVDEKGEVTPDPAIKGYTNYERPGIDKKIDGDFKRGQEKQNFTKAENIPFSIDFTIPKNAKVYTKLQLTDELQKDNARTTDLHFIEDSFKVVSEDGSTNFMKGIDYKVTFNTEKNQFELSFITSPDGKSVTDRIAGQNKVKIVYAAEFKGDVTPNGNYSNKVDLTYKNGNNTEERYDKDREKFTTYGFTVKKVDDGLFTTGVAAAPLKGASFILKDAEGNVFKGFEKAEDGKDTQAVFGPDKPGQPEFFSDTRDEKGFNYVLKSDENGRVTVNGLAAGEYTLVETQAPMGYSLPANPETKITVGPTTSNEGVIDDIKNDRKEFVITGREDTFIKVAALGTGLVVLGGYALHKKKEQEISMN